MALGPYRIAAALDGPQLHKLSPRDIEQFKRGMRGRLNPLLKRLHRQIADRLADLIIDAIIDLSRLMSLAREPAHRRYCYSHRSARTGSMRRARRIGTKAAASAVAMTHARMRRRGWRNRAA